MNEIITKHLSDHHSIQGTREEIAEIEKGIPITVSPLAAALRLPEVRALVEALMAMQNGYLDEANPYSVAGFRRDLYEDECYKKADAALAAIKEATDD